MIINIANCDTFDIVRSIFSLDKIEDNIFIDKQIKINSNLNYLYTEYSSDSLYNRSLIHFHKIQFHSPIINKKLQLGCSYEFNYSEYKNILNTEYTFGSINFLSKNYDIYLKTKLNKHSLKIKYKHKSIDNNFLLKIYKFPHSKTDSTVNKYLYNLLEPTFGDSINFYPKTINNIINIYYSAPQIFNFYPFINLQFHFVNMKIDERHLNTNSPKLDGEKYTQIGNTFYPFQLKLGITSKKNNMFFFGYSETNLEPKWKQIVSPESYDINVLSNGNFKFTNWKIGYKNNAGKKYYFLGASQGKLKWQQELSTPVLGYWFFLPISHQLNIDLQIFHKTQIVQYGIYFNNKHFSINPEFGYIHSLLSIDMNYIANLEYGLTSINEHKNYLYDINLFNLKLHSSYSFKEKIKIYFDCSQMIPYIRKISGGELISKPEKRKKKYYGGLMIEIGMNYYY